MKTTTICAIYIFAGILIGLLIPISGFGSAVAFATIVILWLCLALGMLNTLSRGKLAEIWDICSGRLILMAISVRWLIICSLLKLTAWHLPHFLRLNSGDFLLSFIALLAWLLP
jgi:hypothetical protein